MLKYFIFIDIIILIVIVIFFVQSKLNYLYLIEKCIVKALLLSNIHHIYHIMYGFIE
jgi:hypothetical protein